MTDMQLVALAITLLSVFAAMYGNRKSVEDMRDVLRAEFKAGLTETRAEMQISFQRIENKLDHIAETLANHADRIERLERKGGEGG